MEKTNAHFNMNDPHVVSVIYHVDHDSSVDYMSASPLCHETEQFRICIEDGTARFELKEHFATAEAACEVVEPYIEKWEFEAGLRTRPDQFKLHFGHAEIIDRNPPPPTPGTISISATFSSPPVSMSVAVTKVATNYPAPPSECASDPNNPDVITMYHRYELYRLGREPLVSMAYFCLTVLEEGFQNNRRGKAAQKYCIDKSILDKIGELTGKKGGLDARKAIGTKTELTTQEQQFLKKSLAKIIFCQFFLL